jgi:hypothetical protein
MEEGTVVTVVSKIGYKLLIAGLEDGTLLCKGNTSGIHDCKVIPKDVKAFYETCVTNLNGWHFYFV